MNIRLQVTDTATPGLQDAVNTLTHRRAAKVAGMAVRVLIRKHLAAKNRQPNKKNWPKTQWFARARDRVMYVEDGVGVAVVIDFPGFAMRYTGDPAVIRPVNAKNLAIPMHQMAYGRRPREFKDLIFIPVLRGRTTGFLAMQVGVGAAKVWINLYRLVKFVRTTADPTMLPKESELLEAGRAAIVAAADVSLR
jgi:hypothetical protein